MAKSTARKNLSIDTKNFTIRDYSLKKPDAYKPKSTATVKKQASAKLGAKVDPTKKKSPKPLKEPTGLAAVAKRFNITAREARDIATAVGTSMQGRKSQAGGTKDMARENLIRQIKEVGTAAKSGKKGSTSDKFIPEYSSYYPGSKRKKLG